LPQYGLILITAVLAAVAAAAVPSAGLITLSLIMSTVGVPLEGIGLIIAVDRLIDMARSGVNIWANACATVNLSALEAAKPIPVEMIQAKVSKKRKRSTVKT
jgi:Na+/H+-dicarboxylate symporters